MRSITIGSLTAVFAIASALLLPAQGPIDDSPAEPYLPEKLAEGELSLGGARTMSALAALWSRGFKHIHPASSAKLDFQGSSAALNDLTGDGAAVGLLSRELTKAEVEAFTKAHPGAKLLAVDVAFDAIAVVVHPDNPIEGLTFAQLKTIYGASKSGETLKWGDLGLEGDWADTPVVRFGPDEKSGARAQFVEQVLGPDAQLAPLTAHAWHTKIIDELTTQRGGIGFVAGANARSGKAKTVPLAVEPGRAFVAMSPETVAQQRYPLRRPLSLVVVVSDDGVKNPLVAEFVRYVLSRNGQDDVVKDGFSPLGRSALLEQFERLGWNDQQ